jgi:hypothetical protein
MTPQIVTQPDDPSDTVSLGIPEARDRFRFTRHAILGVGSIYTVFYWLNMFR